MFSSFPMPQRGGEESYCDLYLNLVFTIILTRLGTWDQPQSEVSISPLISYQVQSVCLFIYLVVYYLPKKFN